MSRIGTIKPVVVPNGSTDQFEGTLANHRGRILVVGVCGISDRIEKLLDLALALSDFSTDL